MSEGANIIGFRTLLFRECHRFLRLWNQTLVPPLVTCVLYILIFGYSLGSQIRGDVVGVPYLHFLIPGLVMMNIISSAYGNTSSSLYIARFQGNIQELLVSSMSNTEIVLGLILGGVARGMVVGLGLAVICIGMAGFGLAHAFVALYFMLTVSFTFSCAGFLSAIWAQDFDRLSLFQTYILTPLTYLGGVFFSVDMLPGVWRNVALANPILYFVNGLRYGFLGVSDVGLVGAMIGAFLVAAVLFAACLHLFRIGYNIKT